MRISDWSSDVCSSDLHPGLAVEADDLVQVFHRQDVLAIGGGRAPRPPGAGALHGNGQSGRESCRARGGWEVLIPGGAVIFKKKKTTTSIATNNTSQNKLTQTTSNL